MSDQLREIKKRILKMDEHAMRNLICLILWALAFFFTAHVPALTQPLEGYVSFSEIPYELGCGDVLNVNVYHHSDFNQSEILVRCDGYASFNGVGELQVSGKTVQMVQRMLHDELQELLVDPIVTVTIARPKPGTVYVAGAVREPGMYQFQTSAPQGGSASGQMVTRVDMRISNVLANAGGVDMNADLTQVEIRRNGQVHDRLDLWKLIRDGDASQDIFVQSGDIVYVPKVASQIQHDDETFNLLLRSTLGPKTFPVRVLGKVEKPGLIDLAGSSPYLNTAIAVAGGYKEGAHPKTVVIRRFSTENDFSTIYVDPHKGDLMLKPNDVVYIPEEKIYRAGGVMDQVSKILSPFTSMSSVIFGAALLKGI